MLFNDLIFNEAIDLTKITNPSLCGGTLKPRLRDGDLHNFISIGSASAVVAASRFKESFPYSKEYDIDGNLEVIINWHFIVELRRQLSGAILDGTSTFSPSELLFYEDYQAWAYGAAYTGELLIALEYLDAWLVDEITNSEHPLLERDYSTTHKWNKIFEREVI